jgi:hypothetical protein
MKHLVFILFILLTASAFAAQPQPTNVTVAKQQTYTPGTRIFGPVTVPIGTAKISATFDVSTHTDPVVTWMLTTEISRDAGVTWKTFVEIGRRLGGITYRGIPASFSQVLLDNAGNPAPADENTQIRGTYTIDGGNLQTEIKVILE